MSDNRRKVTVEDIKKAMAIMDKMPMSGPRPRPLYMHRSMVSHMISLGASVDFENMTIEGYKFEYFDEWPSHAD